MGQLPAPAVLHGEGPESQKLRSHLLRVSDVLFGALLYCKKYEMVPGWRRKIWPRRPSATALRMSYMFADFKDAPFLLSACGGSKND